ncbi:DUF2635 domain-containing protein [Acetobacter orientalis]|uniref:DUF2635 domain-containing protein n=1 Tax=Acetobacter orientalis TaxID=146474 RepID=UPI0020A15CC3|nr:DUF2635 domain-containing protein [Acetobacter orientalis]MCP1217110.1 DUF2635 domain-containing protein [Acetobacter orientalis]MCP1220037.1 DUF2635 domain-containing protein [Acetobacter orientalis]
MTETKLVTPGAGRHVVTPAGNPVPQKFRINPADPYWGRMLRDKDIVEVKVDAATTQTVPPVVPQAGDKK